MDAADLLEQVDSYLVGLRSLCHRWTAWLSEQEQAIVAGDFHLLDGFSGVAEKLFADLWQLHQTRQSLLNSGSVLGFNSQSLNELAQQLPGGWTMTRRKLLRQSRSELSQLRRLHVAASILLALCGRDIQQTLTIIAHGEIEASVYSLRNESGTMGGQLLDAQA